MAGVINTGSFPKALWEGLNEWWGDAYREKPEQWRGCFQENVSHKAYEEDVAMSGTGLAPVKIEGEALKYDTMKQSFVSRYTNVAYALGFVITREEVKDNLYPQLGRQRARALGFSQRQTKENVAANIFNRGFNASFPGGDGKSLLANDHPIEGGTFSNILTRASDLSEASLEDALVDISLFRNNRNLLIDIQGETLLVPSALRYDAIRILKNADRPATADRDINAMYNNGDLPGGIKVNSYLTDSDSWFILTNSPDGLKYFNREDAVFEDDNDFATKNLQYSAYARYVFGWTDPRGIYGSPGA